MANGSSRQAAKAASPGAKAPSSLRNYGVASAIGLALGSLAMPAVAQQRPTVPVTTVPPDQLPTLPVGADRQPFDYKVDRAVSPKFTEPLRDTPRSVVVIPKELIKDQGVTTMKDLLRLQPGITLGTGEGGNALGDRILIRGFEARGDIFVDGMRDPGVSSRETFNVEQVDIIKGPGSTYIGRGGTGGSVNIVSKTPKKQSFYAADVTGGTDNLARVTADVNQVVNDNIAFRVSGMFHYSETPGRDPVYQQRWGIAPSVIIGLNSDTNFTLSYYHLSSKELPDYGVPFDSRTQRPLAVGHDRFYGLVNRDFRHVSADIFTGTFNHKFTDWLSFRQQLRYGWTTNDYVVSAPEGPNLATGTVNANAKQRNSIAKLWASQTDFTAKFDTGPVKHTLVAGFEISKEIVKNYPYSVTPTGVQQNLWDPNPYLPWAGTVRSAGTFTKSTVDSKAIYIFDTAKIGSQLELSGGLRLDNYNIYTAATAAASNGLANESTFLNWNAGVVYKPLPTASFYALFASSSNPSGEQLDGGGVDYGAITATNQSLAPERNYLYEVGTKWDVLGEKLALTLAGFRIDKTNARVTVPGGGVQAMLGKQRVYGIEVGANGKITDEWSIFAGFTWLNTRVVSAVNPADVGKELPNVAPISFSLWSTYQILPKFTIGGLAQYTGPRNGGTAVSGTAYIPGYWRFDAMANYKVTDNVDVRFNVQNITNKVYYDAVYRSGTPFAYIGPGRSFSLTTAVKF
jgi:catecholate siderophore receptor